MMSMANFRRLRPAAKARTLADAFDRSAERCDENMLLKGTWVAETFRGSAERLRELAAEIDNLGKRK